MEPGARLGPYEIVALLGAGGMGEVYRARDPRLRRDVAIKVLPLEFATDPDRLRRFEQEARAVAALNHPNILAIYDVGTHEGAPYIVTELLEGESLHDRLRSGGLPVRKAVETAVQIAQGLAAAHEKGIIHRDLKPGNVFVTKDGHVKILDFGIAKLAPQRLAEPGQATTLVEATQVGITLGTVGYMSPEQVRGQSVDHRSDIFSFGCVLYEILSGEAPFRRDTVADTASAILHEDPAPFSGTGQAIAPALQEIVSRCLEKRAEERFSSAHDLALALRAYTTGEAPAATASVPFKKRRAIALGVIAVAALAAVVGVLVQKLRPAVPKAGAGAVKKIVVLPFENLGLAEDAYFASGMAEEITSRLANVQGLGVISRTTAMEYARRGKTVKEIGAELGVDYVLEGSVRWEHGQGRESRVRITPQLIRVADDTHVWADRYERVLADVFAIQSEVAENAVRAMGVRLLPRERTALEQVSTSDLVAYDLYLRGRELEGRGFARAQIEGALRMYQEAVDHDPRFAVAHAGAARMHAEMYWQYYDRSQERLEKVREAAERAVELRPDLAETHTALGNYYYRGLLNYPQALKEFAAALEIQPNSGEALEGVGGVLRRQGRWGEAAEKFRKASELDPRNVYWLFSVGLSCELARDYADSERAFEAAIAVNPRAAENWANRAWLAVLRHGDVDKAQAILDEAARVAGLADDAGFLAMRRLHVALARRDYEGALRQLQVEARDAIDNQLNYWPIALLRGQVHNLAGHHDLARLSLEAARVELEQRVRNTPNDHRLHSSLGIAYAGLGRKEDAVREARLGCDLMPEAKDAFRAMFAVWDLAEVYTMVGEHTEAIAVLDDLLARSGLWTPHVLRLEPSLDPLRSDPRFQALLTKFEVKK